MNNPIKICLTGLVSSGKTTMINSLTGKRLSETGITRTTKTPKLYGGEKLFPNADHHDIQLISDDDHEYCILDLPGVNDSEDKNGDFDEQTKAYILSFDIILWVSDVHTSFSTKHEKEQFETIIKILNQNSLETGTIYQYGIVLTKYDKSTNQTYDVILESDGDDECEAEITTDREEFNIDDKYKFVSETYPTIPVMKFNSHGRIIYGKSSSNLKRLIQTLNTCPTNNNVVFNLRTFVNNYEKVRIDICKNSLNYTFKKILEHICTTDSFQYMMRIKSLSTKYSLTESIIVMKALTKSVIKIGSDHKYFCTILFHLYNQLLIDDLLLHFSSNIDIKMFIWLLSNKREHALAYLREYANTELNSNRDKLRIYQIGLDKKVIYDEFCIWPLSDYYQSGNIHKFSMRYISEISFDTRIHTNDFYKLSFLKEIETVRKELYGQDDDCNIIAMMTEARINKLYYKRHVISFDTLAFRSILSDVRK